MKQIHYLLSLIFILLCSIDSYSQTTINNSSIPMVGDSVKFTVDNLPQNIDLSVAGEDMIWDFTGLQGPFGQLNVYESDTSVDFPDANAVIRDNQVETWYRISPDSLEIIGVRAPDPLGLTAIRTDNLFMPPLVQLAAPRMYNEHFNQNSVILTYVDPAALPPELLDLLPLTPDSIRLRITTDQENDIDAWGTLLLQNESFEVLRQKIRQTTNVRIEMKVSIFPWADLTDLVAVNLPPGTLTDTTVNYSFLANGVNEPVAIVQVDEEDIAEQVTFKTDIFTSVKSVDTEIHGVYVYPNPSFGEVRFEFINLDPGHYKLTVHNVLGKELWSTQDYISGSKVISADLSRLKRGAYFYALQNKKGKRLITRRLIIIKP